MERMSYSKDAVSGERTPYEKRHILVVDDDNVSLRIISNLLKKYFRISVANSGVKALIEVGKDQPDLILLDYEMPGINGAQWLELFRSAEEYSSIPVVFLSGVTDVSSIRNAMKTRPQGYMLKTAGQVSLIAKIEEVLYESGKI